MHPPPPPPNDATATATATAISGVPAFFLLQLVSSPVAVEGPPLAPPPSSGNPSPCLPPMAPQQQDPLQEPRQFAAVSSACANQRGRGEAAPMRLGFKAMPCAYKSHGRSSLAHILFLFLSLLGSRTVGRPIQFFPLSFDWDLNMSNTAGAKLLGSVHFTAGAKLV